MDAPMPDPYGLMHPRQNADHQALPRGPEPVPPQDLLRRAFPDDYQRGQLAPKQAHGRRRAAG